MYLREKNKEKIGIFKIIVQERKRRNVDKKNEKISKDDNNEISMKNKRREIGSAKEKEKKGKRKK